MKRYLIRILLFFAIVAFVDMAIGNIADYMQANAKGGDTKQLNDFVVNDRYDIFILGSSRAHHHYVPQVFKDSLGMDCYNGGRDGNGIIFQYGIYKMITERYHPQLVIYDVEPAFDIYEFEEDVNHTRYLSALKPYYKHPEVEQTFKDVSTIEYLKVHSGLFRHNSALISIFIDYLVSRGDNTDSSNGYSPLFGAIKQEYNKIVDEERVDDALKQSYMLKLIKDASDNQIPLLIVASPKHGATNSDCFNDIKQYCEDYNVPFFDYYADSYFMAHPEYFKEPMHLNGDGAELFTKVVVEYIKNHDKSIMDN